MRVSKVIAVKEFKYEITQLPTAEGMKVIGRYGGQILSAFAAFKQGKVFVPEPSALSDLCDVFAPHTQVVKGKQSQALSGVFDEHFAGRYFDVFVWLKESLEFNFAPFFEEIGSLLNTEKAE